MGITPKDIAAQRAMIEWGSVMRERKQQNETNHDAVPEAIANAESVAPQPTAGDRSGNPTSHSGTGKQPAPPCVETDGFSSGSRTGPIIQPPERESPRRECGESSLRDVPRPDTKGKAAGGPEPLFISVLPVSYAKTNAERVDYAVNRDTKQPRNGAVDDESDRPQPIKDRVSDRPKPISQNELSALDRKLKLEHGMEGNPMIKARRNKESAGAGITDVGPRLRQMNDVLEENERLRGQLAWTERERDSLRVAIHTLRDYVADVNAVLYGKIDENRVLYDTKRDATPQPQATPPQGSVHGEGSFRDSRNAKDPAAWHIIGAEYDTGCEYEYATIERGIAEAATAAGCVVVPLYRQPAEPCPYVAGATTRYCTLTPFTLTDEEREAVRTAMNAFAEDNANPECAAIEATLWGLLERLK